MKRILHSLKTGVTEIVETPVPQLKSGHILIQTTCSLISPGTEKMLIDFGKASWIDKVRQQPDKVKMVFDKVKTDGLLPTIEAVRNKLDQLLPLGYCNVGKVIAVGKNVEGFAIGDRVISNGSHAEIVCVPKNLCCKIPDSVSDADAAFSVLGAIGLQGIRLANPVLGEFFVVVGLGLIGLLTVQLLIAQGCHVLAIDFDENKLALAKQFGAQVVDLSKQEDPVQVSQQFSRGRGVDGVLITASTKSNEPVHQAAQMCRKRGRIILIGVTGLELSRADFYEKELSFQVSCSYGPGRYDEAYEEQGHDYPFAFVRWTEQRNFEAFLDMLAMKKIAVNALLTQKIDFSEAGQAYQTLADNKHTLGVLLKYGTEDLSIKAQHSVNLHASQPKISAPRIGFIGAGNYASRILIPALKNTNAVLKTIVCMNGVSGTQIGKKYGFEKVTTDVQSLFSDADIDSVIIATRHDSHAKLVLEALNAGKHVFVEKPLCLTLEELNAITQKISHSEKLLMVGFNRRFAPQIQKIKSLLQSVNVPKAFVMTVNAGEIPAKHWTQDRLLGGGRVIGEGCHFVDLLRFLAAAPITNFHVTKMDNVEIISDKVSISLNFADGSIGTIHYLANGHKSFSKERLEIFVGGKILQLDNFRKLRGFGWSQFRKMDLWRQDKGQKECMQNFIKAIQQGKEAPIPIADLLEVSRVVLEMDNSIKQNET